MPQDLFNDAAPWWRRRGTLIALAVLTALIWWLGFNQSRRSPVWVPGQFIDSEPVQEKTGRDPWEGPKGSTITPFAEYEIEARVLGRKDYSDAGAFISPMDLALGWGEMSKEDVISALKMRQSGRWYHYSWSSSGPPIPLRDIIRQSANTHLIPGSQEVEDILEQVVEGDRVRLSGILVGVQRPDGWRWRSSLSRTDSGGGSCELMWVESAEILGPADVGR